MSRQVGGLVTDRHGYIVREWRYDLGAHMPPPTGVLEVRLNKSMSFEFLNRGDMRVKFSHEGVSHELDAGVRPKRVGTYLDNRLVGSVKLMWTAVVHKQKHGCCNRHQH